MKKDEWLVLIAPWIVGFLTVGILLLGPQLYVRGHTVWAALCGLFYIYLVFGTRRHFDDLQDLLERKDKKDG